MIPGLTKSQRQEQRYTMDAGAFWDRVLFLGALAVIFWLVIGWPR